MAKKTGPEAIVLAIPKPDLRTIRVKIVGDSSLIMHAWSEKARKQMRDKQQGKAPAPREKKNPQKEYEAAFYRMPGGKKPAFPAGGFKRAMVSACRQIDGFPMTVARGAFAIMDEFVEIKGRPSMREDMVRVGNGVADMRYRPEFEDWSTVLTIKYNAGVISAEQILNLLTVAGFAVGIGDWRPEKSGDHGMFHVE